MTDTATLSGDARMLPEVFLHEDGCDGSENYHFKQPWHAQAFGLAMVLGQADLFDWSEWVDLFSSVIRDEPQADGETSNEAYYRQLQTALERMLAQRTTLTEEDIEGRAEDWRKSYLVTPHGHPVELRLGLTDVEPYDDDHHHHHAKPEPRPIAVVSGAVKRAGVP